MFYRKKLTLAEIKQNYDALKNVYKNGDFVIDNIKTSLLPFNANNNTTWSTSTGTFSATMTGSPSYNSLGYTYVAWARLGVTSSYRTLLYTKISSDKYTPITIPNGENTLGWWDRNPPGQFRSSGYGLTSSVDVWVQYAVVGDNSSHTYYINCLLYTSPSPRDRQKSRMPSSA